MKIYKFDKSFRDNSAIFAIVILIFILIFGEIQYKVLMLCLIGIYIYFRWYNIVEVIQIDKDSLQMNIRFFTTVKIISIKLQDVNYSYKLEEGFRKSIMKLRIYYEDKNYEISISMSWSNETIQEIVQILKNSNAKEVNL